MRLEETTSEPTAKASLSVVSRGSGGGHVATLAPILETDDIVVENGEPQTSTTNVLADPGGAASAPGDGDAPGLQPSPTRRASLMATTMENTRRSLGRHVVHRVSLGAFAQSASDAFHNIGRSHAKTSPDVIRAMKPRARLNFYLSQPEDSQTGWIIHHVLFIVLIVNVAIMAAETLDGPRFSGSDPGYPYLPGDSFFINVEGGFTVLYIIEFVLRVSTAKNQKLFWRSKTTWLEIIAWIPALIYQGLAAMSKDDPAFNGIELRDQINYLRLARLIRIILVTRVYVGSKVMFKAIKESIGPLKICLFFLITVVMVFATAIFYAEPCYDLKTCTFTDIFNAGYFVMVTVATVGYGSQVPSLFNGGSLVLTCVVMIFGSLYLAMPLAIIGIRYDSAWREFERTKSDRLLAKRQGSGALNSTILTASGLSMMKRTASKDGRAASVVDETLQPLESRKVYALSYGICDRFYDISTKLGEINTLVQSLCSGQPLSSRGSISPPGSPARLGSFNASDEKKIMSFEATQVQRMKARNELTVRVLENIMAMLKVHKKICSEIRALLPASDNSKSKANLLSRTSSASQSNVMREGSFSKTATFATGVFGRARRALSTVGKTRSIRFVHDGPPTWKSRIWDILEHNDLSRRAKRLNKVRLVIVVLSIALFYAQTTPELQDTGVKTPLCRRSIEDFCNTNAKGYADQAGCFVLDQSGAPTTALLNFDCSETDQTDPGCYGNGFNYGSNNFTSTCGAVFGRKGTQRICNNRLCKPPVTLLVDMESKWIFFEFFFGILFTAEALLRVLVHPNRKKMYSDLTFLIDLIALFPFYVEVAELIGGTMPMYSVVPTAPSFFAVIRVFKTFRVLKLGTHISGSEVLARTALLVYKRLMIPIFFLFIGSVICGAIFYELERGTECFVGQDCVWWGKQLLTPAIVKNHPNGKRLMVQNDHPSLISDMLRSTWFSIVTITTVGYGDMRPRTSLGRFFDILTMIMSACYTAMPLTLVGGQFYVCYEMYLVEKRRKAQRAVEPKTHDRVGQELDLAVRVGADNSKGSEQREPALISLAGLTDEPVIPGLNAPIGTSVSPPASPEASKRSKDPLALEASKEPQKPSISSVELQILSQFILIHKVLNEVIEDLSQLNRLGSQRIAAKKEKDESGSGLLPSPAEVEIQAKIQENMVFCVTVFLNFAPVIEKILGVDKTHAIGHAAGGLCNLQMPSILHAPSTSPPESPLKELR